MLPKECGFGYLQKLVLPPYAVSMPNISLWSSCSYRRRSSASAIGTWVINNLLLLIIPVFRQSRSCVLKAPAVECRLIPAIDTWPTCQSSRVDTRSTCQLPPHQPVSRQSVDSQGTESYFLQTFHRVSINTSGDHTFNVGWRIDCYLMVSCRLSVDDISVH